MFNENAPIGVFDSGIGGLTVLRALRRRMPAEDLLYLGDTARVPYGTKSAETIVRFAREDARFLLNRGVKLLVVACHSASSVALRELAAESSVPVIGVIEPGARALVAATRNSRVAVIGTSATIRAAAYERTIRGLRPDIEIVAKATPLLVPLAEEGWGEEETENPTPKEGSRAESDRARAAEMVCRSYLGGLAAEGIDALLLGCTHFPLLARTIGRVLGPAVKLVDASEETASAAAELLLRLKLARSAAAPGRLQIYLSDLTPGFETIAPRFLGSEPGELMRATLADK